VLLEYDPAGTLMLWALNASPASGRSASTYRTPPTLYAIGRAQGGMGRAGHGQGKAGVRMLTRCWQRGWSQLQPVFRLLPQWEKRIGQGVIAEHELQPQASYTHAKTDDGKQAHCSNDPTRNVAETQTAFVDTEN